MFSETIKLLVLAMLPNFMLTTAWIKVPPNGIIKNKHYMFENAQVEVCEKEVEETIIIPYSEQLSTISDNLIKFQAKYSSFTSKLISSFKTDDYVLSSGKRLFSPENTLTFKAMMETCANKDGFLTEITDNQILKQVKTFLKLTKQTKKVKQIWQPINSQKHIFFIKSKNHLPQELTEQVVQNNLPNIHENGNCALFNIDTLNFEEILCESAKRGICTSNLQPEQLSVLMAQNTFLAETTRTLLNNIETLKDTVSTFPDITVEPEGKKYHLFKDDTMTLYQGLDLISNTTYLQDMVNFNTFFLSQTNKITQTTKALKNNKPIILEMVCECEDTVHKTAATNFPQNEVKHIKRSGSNLVVTTSQYQTCHNYTVKTALPITTELNYNTHGNFTFLNNICYEVPIDCFSSTCLKSKFKENWCCSNLLNDTTKDCNPTKPHQNFYLQNATTLLFSSTTKILIKSNCTEEVAVNAALIKTGDSCHLQTNSSLPFQTPDNGHIFLFLGEDGLAHNTTNISEKPTPTPSPPGIFDTIQDKLTASVLPYLTLGSALATILMFCISLYLICSKRQQQTPNQNETDIPLQSLNTDKQQNPEVKSILKRSSSKKSINFSESSSEDDS